MLSRVQIPPKMRSPFPPSHPPYAFENQSHESPIWTWVTYRGRLDLVVVDLVWVWALPEGNVVRLRAF